MAENADKVVSRRGEDLTGRKFSRLTVIKSVGVRTGPSGQTKAFWECVCECGRTAIVEQWRLVHEQTKSCGCLLREVIGKVNLQHGLSGHPLFITWKSMIARCANPNEQSFKDYGARGIKVEEPWLSSFKAFYDDMIPTWQKGLTIDRKDVNGNYCKENCRWATRREQGLNKRNNILITMNGATHPVSEWCRILNLDARLVYLRIGRGWSGEKALTAPKTYRG